MPEQGALWTFLSNFQHTALRALNNAGKSLNHFSWPLSPISSLVCFPKGSNHSMGEFPSLSFFNWISAIVDFLSNFQKLRPIHLFKSLSFLEISIYARGQMHDKGNISGWGWGTSGIGELNTYYVSRNKASSSPGPYMT